MERKSKKLKERLPHNAIKDIAELAGVSFVVVSRVINRTVKFKRTNGKEVRVCSEITERRILDVAEKYASKHEELKRSMRSI